MAREKTDRELTDFSLTLASTERDERLPSPRLVDSTAAGKGVLYVVATPIGNLDDITLRALDVLKTVDLIACEDTRNSRVLLDRWNIRARLMSLHKFSEARKIDTILERLRLGDNVALISDSGTPAVSDPGSRLVRAVLDRGFRVMPIPGPSSITAALSASGMEGSSFVYWGFAPKRPAQRKDFFERIAGQDLTSVFFETPIRILPTMEIAAAVLSDRRIVLMRELTKIHEEILTGTASEILAALSAREAVKGEIVVLVEGRGQESCSHNLGEMIKELIDEGLSGKRLADEAHKRYRVRKSLAYDKFLELTGGGDLLEVD